MSVSGELYPKSYESYNRLMLEVSQEWCHVKVLRLAQITCSYIAAFFLLAGPYFNRVQALR